MRNACKNVMYTVVSSWAYDGEHEETGMENWKKAGIGIDIVIALFNQFLLFHNCFPSHFHPY